MSSKNVKKQVEEATHQGRAQHVRASPEDHGAGMSPRSHTDTPCCLFYIIYMVGMGLIIAYSVINGDPRRLTHGMDYKGNLCGVDLPSKPYLFWCRGGSDQVEQAMGGADFHGGGYPTDLDLNNPICVDQCPDSSQRMFPCLDPPIVKQDTVTNGPETQTVVTATEKIIERAGYRTIEFGGHFCIPAFNNTKSGARDMLIESGPLGDVGWNMLLAIGGLRHAPLALLFAAIMAVVFGFLYLKALKEFAGPVIYFMLFLLGLFFLAAGIWFLGPVWMPQLIPDQWESVGKAHNPFYNSFDKQIAGRYSAICGGVFLLIFVLLICVYCCLRDAIKTALAVIKAACDCMWQLKGSMMMQPIFEVIFKVVIFFALLYGFTYLVSTGYAGSGREKVFNTSVPGYDKEFHYDHKAQVMIGYYLFGMFWCMELLTSLGQFVISYCVVMWYFTPVVYDPPNSMKNGKKRSIPINIFKASTTALWYHLGSLAFGAALIAFCRFMRMILGYIAKAEEAGGNPVAVLIAKILICCVTCFKKFMEFVNKNAYIDVCITSSSFCVAAKHTFDFLIMEGGKVMALNGICFVFEVMGAFAIASCSSFSTYMLVTNWGRFADNTSPNYVAHPEVCTAVAFLISLTVAAACMNLFDHTADTLLYTFAWNRNHDHNSAELYCPPELAKLLEYEPEEDRYHHPGDPTKTQGQFSFLSTWFTGKTEEPVVDEHERRPMISYSHNRRG